MDWIKGYEYHFVAEAQGLRSGNSLDEFVPPVRLTDKEVGKSQEVSEPLNRRFGLE